MSWRTVPLKHVAPEVRTAVDPASLGNIEVDHFSIPALDETGGAAQQAAGEIQSQKQLLCGGELLVSRLNPRKARVLTVPPLSGRVALASGEFVVLQPSRVDSRFLRYLLLSEVTRQHLDGAVQSVTRSHQRIRPEQLLTFKISMPDDVEQRAIADFLDTETTRIDALITKKRRLIELLEERANSRILDIVGMSRLVGQSAVPTERVRRLLRKHTRPAVSSGEMVTAFRDGEVTTRSARGREGFANAWTEHAQFQRVEMGDVVVHGLDGFSGAIGDAQRDGICSPVYHVCSPVGGDSAFYGRLLRLLALDGYLGNFAISTRERAVDFRNWDLFGRIPIPVAPLSTQCQIGDQIRAVRPLREKILASEALAQEHRQALITAAVTGELEIPGAAA